MSVVCFIVSLMVDLVGVLIGIFQMASVCEDGGGSGGDGSTRENSNPLPGSCVQ